MQMPANANLQRTRERGWTAGFRNLLKKENGKWWNLRSVTGHLLLWLFIINGIVAFTLFVLPSTGDIASQAAYSTDPAVQQQIADGTFAIAPGEIAGMGMQIFFLMSGLALVIGAVIIAHDSILKERETGTAAWILSKPVSRKAFVLSKLLANSVGMLILLVLAQGIVAYILCSVAQGSPANALPFFAGLGIIGLDCLFFLVLAIVLGAFTRSRGVTLGLPIMIALTGNMIMQVLPQLGYVMPWNLSSLAIAINVGVTEPTLELIAPILATALWIVLFSGAAVNRFEQIEL